MNIYIYTHTHTNTHVHICIHIHTHTHIYIHTYTHKCDRRWRENASEKSFVDREIVETAGSSQYKFHGAFSIMSKINSMPGSFDMDEDEYADGPGDWNNNERRDVRAQRNKSHINEIEEVSSRGGDSVRLKSDRRVGLGSREEVIFNEDEDARYKDEDEFRFGDDKKNDSRLRGRGEDTKPREKENDFRYRERGEDFKAGERAINLKPSAREEDYRFENDPDTIRTNGQFYTGPNDMYDYGGEQEKFERERLHSGSYSSRAPSGYEPESPRPHSPQRRYAHIHASYKEWNAMVHVYAFIYL
jgi:hypothetical protein